MNKIKIDVSVIETFECSKAVMGSANFITRKIFDVMLFLVPDTPVQQYLSYNTGMDFSEIANMGMAYIASHSEEEITAYFIDFQVDTHLYRIEKSLYELLVQAADIAKTAYNTDVVSVSTLLAALAESYYEEFMHIIQYFITDFNNRRSTSKNQENLETISRTFIIPKDLSSFLTNMNENYWPEDECKILGRDAETKKLVRILSKANKRNAVLVGAPGVGKTALVEKLTWMIVTGNCPENMKNSIVLSLDVTSIVAGTQYRGSAEERFKNLIKFLEGKQYNQDKPDIILFIDEIHTILGAGACREGDLDLSNALKPILARGDARVIGATTQNEYEKYFSSDGALKRRFEKVFVPEPCSHEIYPMIKNQVSYLKNCHGGIKISKNMIDFIILNASAFNYDTANPDRTLDLIDKSLTEAELDGKSCVTKAHVRANFEYNKELYAGMTDEQKRSTAYHEGGHLILNRYAPHLKDQHVIAVSIMPAEHYLGVNVLEPQKNITVSYDKVYYVEKIASYLAGRVAEELFTDSITSGACEDLARANNLAKDVITKYGLDNTFSIAESYPIYISDLSTDELKSSINKRIESFLDIAYAYAKNVLTSHKAELDCIVEALVKHGILSENDINKILN